MPYRMLVPGTAGDTNFEPGDILDLPDDYASSWVQQGLAVQTDDPATISGAAALIPLTFPQLQADPGAEPEGDQRPVNEAGESLNKDGSVSKSQPAPLEAAEAVEPST